MYDLMRRKNGRIRDKVIGLARELIRTPSQSLREGAVADLVEGAMRQLGYEQVLRDEAGNVVGVVLGREAGPTLLLNSHMDTVSPGNEDRWTYGPHEPRLEDGRLYGLGASDCKGGLAAQLHAAALLKQCLLPLKGNLVVAATAAEENGRSVGMQALIERTLPELGLEPTWAVLGEPTELGLYYGHDGWVEFELKVEGANPFHVDDAAHALYRHLNSERRDAGRGGRWEEANLYWPHFEEGAGLRRARIRMDQRLPHRADLDGALARLKRNADMVAGSVGTVAVDVAVRQESQLLYTGRTITVRNVSGAWTTDPFHPLMERSRQALAAAGCEVRPGTWQLDRLRMGTAGSVLVNRYGVPTIGYGPGSEKMAHAADECVEVERIAEAVYGTAAIAHALIGVPVFGWTSDQI